MRSNHRRTAVLVALSLCFMPVTGQAQELQSEIEKIVKDGSAKLAEEVGKLAAKHVAEAQAGLKKELEARDKKISELEARVKRLEAGSKQTAEWSAENLTRAYLGVGHTDVPDDGSGALVTDVLADGPAAAAGLKQGDIIVSINGKAVSSVNLSTAVRTFKPGAKVKLAYLRDGKPAEGDVSLVDKEEFWARRVEKPQPIVLGVLIAELAGGLVVKEVEDGFTGSAAGLKVDDRLTKVNGAGVTSLEEVAAALGKVRSGDQLELGVQRGDASLSITVVGAHEKGEAKLVASTAEEKPAKKEEKKDVVEPEKKEEKKPEKEAAYLGIDVEDNADGPAVIAAVLPDTTAGAFGLKVGDVFKKLNGADVATTSALVAAVKNLSPGDKISLVVSRGGKDVELSDVLVGAPGQKIAAPKKPGSLGIVAEQAPDGRVLVKSLIEGGAAGEAGLQASDLILEANGKSIKSFDDLAGVLEGLHAGDVVSFKVRRGDKDEEVKVTLAEKAS